MTNVYAVETIQNGKRSDVQVFRSLSSALDNMQFVKETAEDDSMNLYRNDSSLSLDAITNLIREYGFKNWNCIGGVQIKDPARYTYIYWQHEAGLPEGREGVYFLQILDPEGEEYAAIIHRTENGQFPIGGRVANEKLERAYNICEALNATL